MGGVPVRGGSRTDRTDRELRATNTLKLSSALEVRVRLAKTVA